MQHIEHKNPSIILYWLYVINPEKNKGRGLSVHSAIGSCRTFNSGVLHTLEELLYQEEEGGTSLEQ